MPNFSMSQDEYDARVRELQQREAAEESARRTTERWHVFVSYSHADQDHRRAVEKMLQRHRIDYVVDAKDIDLGDEISDWALQKIQECSHYLLILSRTSVSAPWCIAEYSMARGARVTTLVYMVDGVTLPPQMSSQVATDNIERLAQYFARDVIDPGAVDRFLEQLLHMDLSLLDQYVRVAGRERYWELRDRSERESKLEASYLVRLLSEDTPSKVARLWSIEERGPGRWRLEIGKGTESPNFHDAYYVLERRALVMEPAFGDLSLVGAKNKHDDGTVTVTAATGSVEEALYGHRLYGWPMSHDFWQCANNRLISLLQ
jgi:TIR domain